MVTVSRKKKQPKRSINLRGITDRLGNWKNLELSKVSAIHTSLKEFIYFDKLPDGTWRMSYTDPTIPDIQELESLEIIRDA